MRRGTSLEARAGARLTPGRVSYQRPRLETDPARRDLRYNSSIYNSKLVGGACVFICPTAGFFSTYSFSSCHSSAFASASSPHLALSIRRSPECPRISPSSDDHFGRKRKKKLPAEQERARVLYPVAISLPADRVWTAVSDYLANNPRYVNQSDDSTVVPRRGVHPEISTWSSPWWCAPRQSHLFWGSCADSSDPGGRKRADKII